MVKTRNPGDRTLHLQRVMRKRPQATRTTKNKALSKKILGYNLSVKGATDIGRML